MNAHSIQLAEIARIAEELDVLCGDDEQCFADMIDGETDVRRIIERLHCDIAEDDELLAGIGLREGELRERKQRLTARKAARKAAVGKFLRAAMLPKIELPEATYSVRDGKPGLRIVDPDAVPEEWCKTKIEPDKTAINTAFADAETLPNWLVRDPARDVVTARTK